MMFRQLVLAAMLSTLPALALGADLSDKVPGHPDLTFHDLLKQAAPDLDADGHGHLSYPPRHLAGKSYDGPLEDPQVFSQIETLRIRAGGRDRLVVLADAGASEDHVESNTLIALYDDGPHPRLRDTALVGVDKDTGFSEVKPLTVGPGDQAFITYSEHSNSSQTYAGHVMVQVRNDRFQLVEHLFTLSSRYCGWESLEEPKFATRPDPGRAYRRIDLDVVETTTVDPTAGCGQDKMPRPHVRHYRASFRWNAARGRYETTSPDLKRLDKFNRDRF